MLLFIVSLVGLVCSAYTDLKEGIIYNELIAAMVVIGFVLQAIRSIFYWDVRIIIITFLTATVVYMVSYTFWNLQLFGGGDVKLFTALAVLNPIGIIIMVFAISSIITIACVIIIWIIHRRIIKTAPFVPAMLIAYSVLAVIGIL